MGFNINCFTTPPSSDVLQCRICYKVIENAVNFGVCRHIFCEDCACTHCSDLHLGLKVYCPSCQKQVTGIYPDNATRESINSMIVRCLNGHPQSMNNDVPSLEVCNWTGRCDSLRMHQANCPVETVICNYNGCSHKCKRRDMDEHLYYCSYDIDHATDPFDEGLSKSFASEDWSHRSCPLRIE